MSAFRNPLEGVVTQALLPRIGGGLVLATEVMVATPAVRAMIREGRAHQLTSVMQAGKAQGMRTMNDSLASLVMAFLAIKSDGLENRLAFATIVGLLMALIVLGLGRYKP